MHYFDVQKVAKAECENNIKVYATKGETATRAELEGVYVMTF